MTSAYTSTMLRTGSNETSGASPPHLSARTITSTWNGATQSTTPLPNWGVCIDTSRTSRLSAWLPSLSGLAIPTLSEEPVPSSSTLRDAVISASDLPARQADSVSPCHRTTSCSIVPC